MQFVVCVLAMVFAGCANDAPAVTYCGNGRSDPNEECEPGQPYCSAGCTLPYLDVTAHWSFETLTGAVKRPCLPGDPDVELHVEGPAPGYLPGWGSFVKTSPCATGELPLSLKPIAFLVWIRSVADHEYKSMGFFVNVDGPGDLPTIVAYTDAGYVPIGWLVYNALGDETNCESVGIESVRAIVDGVVMNGKTHCSSETMTAGPMLAGTHSVRVEALDAAGDVVTTSSPVDSNVPAGGFAATVSAELHVP